MRAVVGAAVLAVAGVALATMAGRTESAMDPAANATVESRPTRDELLFGVNMVANPHILHHPEGYMEDVYRTLQRLGSRMVRLCASPREIEAVRGRRDWAEFDADVDLALRYGMEPMVLICNTPTWALPPEIESLPEGMDPTYQYPYREEFYPDFEDFCRDLAARTKGRIRLFQLWNEPNGCGWHFHDGYNHADEYMPFLPSAWDGIKAGNPDALLLLGSLDDGGGYGHVFLNMAYEIRDRDFPGRRLWDGITVHPYADDIGEKARKLTRLHAIMADHGDGDLPVYVTEYGWRTGPERDEKKQRLVRETLEMFQDPSMAFLGGCIHLSLSDFEGEPGYGLTDENLRPRGSFHAFQGAPRFGASPPCRIEFAPTRAGTIEASWETVLPTEGTLTWRSDAGEGSATTGPGTAHRATATGLPPNERATFRIETRAVEGGKAWETPGYEVRISGPRVTNGSFDDGFLAGIGDGWRIEGAGLCTDATVFPGVGGDDHGQVIFGVPKRSIGLDSEASMHATVTPGERCRVEAVARDVSVKTAVPIRARIGIDAGDGVQWSDWITLGPDETELAVETVPAADLARIVIGVKAERDAERGRPAGWFDRVRIVTVPGGG